MLDEALWLKGGGEWTNFVVLGVTKGEAWTACYKLFEMEPPDRVRDEWWICWHKPLFHLPDEEIPADSMTEKQLREYIVTKYILLRGEGSNVAKVD